MTGWKQVDAGVAPGLGPARQRRVLESGLRNGLQSLLIVGHEPDLGAAALRVATGASLRAVALGRPAGGPI